LEGGFEGLGAPLSLRLGRSLCSLRALRAQSSLQREGGTRTFDMWG
jgi:hypothetical protein